MLQVVVRDLVKLSTGIEKLSTQQTQPQQLATVTASCSYCGSLMHLTSNFPSRFQEDSTLFQQRPAQSQSLVPYSYSNSKCGGNNSQYNSGFQGASSSLQVHSSSSQDDSPTMITPYEQDSSSNKNDVQLLLEGLVDLEASMKNQMATMENRIVDFRKQFDPPSPPLDNLHALIEHYPVSNSSSLISDCEAEKGSCSDVSGVQAGLGIGLEAWRKSVGCEHVGPVAELDQHELDPIPGKVDIQLKKPLDDWAKKKFPYLNALISGHDFTVLIGLVIY
ncbi:Transposon Ty3-G Gag-Pol polyprotein [Senna tora]|uniref:Transposon Ty3-G Gag-Pol polyprotein n=1 Tax=Senna tora TaxID=362788 RepID=A0A834SP99_9FABA|nr:Transposon Ty3-G Gag-Pol polyprotein [Senna tora]